MQTDPAVLNDVLVNDMKLADFPEIKNVFGDRLTTPESLRPMIDQVRFTVNSLRTTT